MNPDAIFGADDTQINGDILVKAVVGDSYDRNASYMVYVPTDMNVADQPGDFEPINHGRRAVTAFLAVNCSHIHEVDPNVTFEDAAELAYIRYLALKYRLISPLYRINDYHCDYNQCELLGMADVNAVLANDDVGFPAVNQAAVQSALATVLVPAKRNALHKAFINLVCLVAYMFRSRGHHYMPEMLAKYNEVWGKTGSKDVAFRNDFGRISTIGLHAIMPIILDDFWTQMKDEEKCDPVLMLRWDCAAAGTALFQVLSQGIKDLSVVFPKIREIMKTEIDYVEQMAEEIESDRWAHSINARFYNATRGRLNENHSGAVGALISAVMTSLTPEADLNKSAALKRAARFAPITGAAMGAAIRAFVKSDKFIEQAGHIKQQ